MSNKLFKLFVPVLFVSTSLFSCGSSNSTSSIKTTINDMYLDEVNELLDSKFNLEFDDNDKFKIMILADVHANGKLSDENKTNIETLIDKENPNLVIFTGDNTNVKNANDLRIALGSMVNHIESEGIAWCHVYGNHDEDSNYSKAEQQVVYENFDYCLSKAGDEELFGVGNYAIPIYDYETDEPAFIIWGLDSGAYLSDYDKKNLIPTLEEDFRGYPNSDYDYIKQNQIDWYKDASEKIEITYGRKIPSLMAFHIPLQENYFAWEQRKELPYYDGMKAEVVGASAVNSGMYDAVRERGDVKAIVNGHDHKNDYVFDYNGVKLCSSTSVTKIAYGDDNQMGARVFEIDKNEPENIKTYMRFISDRLPIPDKSKYDDIKSGTIISDFEKELNYLHSTEVESPYDSTHVQAKIEDGKGVNGSKALAMTRINAANSGNSEIDWSIDTYGKLGKNKYLIAWLDLTGQSRTLDFRKASFGLTKDDQYQVSYITDNNNEKSFPLYYKADNSDEWVTMTHGNDGCFGVQQQSSVKGFKGYFAVPISEMTNLSMDTLNEDSLITGAYFYFSFNEPSYAKGNYVYLDNVMLAEDYSKVDL